MGLTVEVSTSEPLRMMRRAPVSVIEENGPHPYVRYTHMQANGAEREESETAREANGKEEGKKGDREKAMAHQAG